MQADERKSAAPAASAVIGKLRGLMGFTKSQSGPGQAKKILRAPRAAGHLQIVDLRRIADPAAAGRGAAFLANIRAALTSVTLRRLGPNDIFTQTDDHTFVIIFAGLGREDAELECALIAQEVLRGFPAGDANDHVKIRTAAVPIDGLGAAENAKLPAIIDRLVKEQERKARTVAAPQPEQEDDAERFDQIMGALPQVELNFEYKPLWDVRRKILLAYICSMTNAPAEEAEPSGSLVQTYRQAAFDFVALGRVTHELRRLNSVNRRLLMHCPVNIVTLRNAGTWATYKILCERISHTPMRKELVFEICGITPATSNGEIVQAAARLKPHCRAVIARTPGTEIDAGLFKGAALSHLALNAGTAAVAEKQWLGLMDAYAERTEKAGFGAIVTGLSSLSMTVAAVGSGFEMIGGDAIHAPVVRPEFVYRYEARNLLGKLGVQG